MTTTDFQKKKPLAIFLSYFGNHKKLFAVDMLCACLIAGIDLAFPLVTRSALYTMLPDKMYRTFFIVMGAAIGCYLLRSLLNFIVSFYGHMFGVRVEADLREDLLTDFLQHHRLQVGADHRHQQYAAINRHHRIEPGQLEFAGDHFLNMTHQKGRYQAMKDRQHHKDKGQQELFPIGFGVGQQPADDLPVRHMSVVAGEFGFL